MVRLAFSEYSTTLYENPKTSFRVKMCCFQQGHRHSFPRAPRILLITFLRFKTIGESIDFRHSKRHRDSREPSHYDRGTQHRYFDETTMFLRHIHCVHTLRAFPSLMTIPYSSYAHVLEPAAPNSGQKRVVRRCWLRLMHLARGQYFSLRTTMPRTAPEASHVRVHRAKRAGADGAVAGRESKTLGQIVKLEKGNWQNRFRRLRARRRALG